MSDLREWLLSVRDSDGARTPEAIVRAAQAKSSPAHKEFEWNDKVAGEKYRLDQARALARRFSVVVKEATDAEPEVRMRAFYSVPHSSGKRSYEALDQVAEDPFTRQLVLQEMEREWKTLHRKYATFSEFVALVKKDVA